MSETIFFNPGDSLGNFHDYNEAVKKGQIFKHKDSAKDRELVVVTDDKSGEEYAIFYVQDAHDSAKSGTTSYKVSKKI